MSRLRKPDDEEGFTLVELLVSMVILGIFFSVFTGVIVKVFDTTRSQQARSISVDASRNITQVIDRQVRYANAVFAPQTSPNGTQYVAWSSKNRQGIENCFQWRVTPGGVMSWASWQKGTSPTPTFATVGINIGRRGTADIFSLTDNSAYATRQRLSLSFQSGATAGKDGSPTRVTLTALNTRSAGAPSPSACQENKPT